MLRKERRNNSVTTKPENMRNAAANYICWSLYVMINK